MSKCEKCGAAMVPGFTSEGWCSAECDIDTVDMPIPEENVLRSRPTHLFGRHNIAYMEYDVYCNGVTLEEIQKVIEIMDDEGPMVDRFFGKVTGTRISILCPEGHEEHIAR